MKRRERFISISTKIFLETLLIVVLCAVSIGGFSYYIYRKDSIRMHGDAALAAANAVAAAVDIERFAQTAVAEEATEYHYQMKELFNSARIKTGVLYLYSMTKTDDGAHYKYIAVGEEVEIAVFGDLDDVNNYGSQPLEAYSLKQGTVSGIYDNGEYGYLVSAFVPVMDEGGKVIGLVCADIDAADVVKGINAFRNKLIIMAIVSAAGYAALSAFYASRSLGRPIRLLVGLAGRVAEGDLDFNADIRRNDEIGELLANFKRTRDTLRLLIEYIREMSHAHMEGITGTFIDSEHFSGAYREVAEGTNKMVMEYLHNMREILAAINGLGKGDFSVPLHKFPGKKISANIAVETLKSIFKGLSEDISLLAVSSANGDLSRVIDAGKYEGDWQVMVGELNKLLVAIQEPISETAAALRQMADGDFSVQVTGGYKGDFELIKNSFNLSQSAISSYIAEISEVLTQMSRQNFRVSINRAYVGNFGLIKDAINTITDRLNCALNDINESAVQVAVGSKQVSELSVGLAQGAATQASAVEELNVSIQRIAEQTADNAEIVNKADELIKRALKSTDEGRNMMAMMTEAMDGINESSGDISGIIKAIDNIAFQTNLLALNASIEAAHAGTRGAGFAVVAEEVRNLAVKSQESARDTSVLIEASISKAAEGARLVEAMAVSIGGLVERIVEVSKIIGDVAEISADQRNSLNRIYQGIAQISEVTQSNTASSQESAAAAQELSGQAEIFKEAVARFELKA